MAERLDLDRLEQLLETMSPAEIRSRFDSQLAADAECRTFLGHFEAMDTQLARLKHMDRPPVFELPERGGALENPETPTSGEGSPEAMAPPQMNRPRRRSFAKTGGRFYWVLPLAAALFLGLFMGKELWFKDSSPAQQASLPLNLHRVEGEAQTPGGGVEADLEGTPIETAQPAPAEPGSLGETAFFSSEERSESYSQNGSAGADFESASKLDSGERKREPVREASKQSVTPAQELPKLEVANRKKIFTAKKPPVPSGKAQENQPTERRFVRDSALDPSRRRALSEDMSPPALEEAEERSELEKESVFLADSQVQGAAPYDREILDTSAGAMSNTTMTPGDQGADWIHNFQSAWLVPNRAVTASLLSDDVQILWPLFADRPLGKTAFLSRWIEISAAFPAAVFQMAPSKTGSGYLLLRWRMGKRHPKSNLSFEGKTSGTAQIELDGFGRCRSFTVL